MAKATKKPDKQSPGIFENITAASVRGNPKPTSKPLAKEGWKNLSNNDGTPRTAPGMGEPLHKPKNPGKIF